MLIFEKDIIEGMNVYDFVNQNHFITITWTSHLYVWITDGVYILKLKIPNAQYSVHLIYNNPNQLTFEIDYCYQNGLTQCQTCHCSHL